MQITCKTITQESFQVEAEPSDTRSCKKALVQISALKEKIEAAKGEAFPSANQKLIYSGKVLNDEQTLADVNIDDKKFVVVMVTGAKKKPTEGTSSATATVASAGGTSTTTSTEPVATTTTAATTTPSAAPTEAPPLAPPADAAAVVAELRAADAALSGLPDSERDAMIERVMLMGYDRPQVERALRAAFWNPDRAVEYLLMGLPSSGSSGANPAVAVPAAAVVDDGGEEGVAAEELGGGGGGGGGAGGPLTLEFLRQLPQFEQMRQLVQANPEVLPALMQEMAQSNPELLQLITQNQEQFVEMLNQPTEEGGGGGGPAGGQGGGAQNLPPGTAVIHVSQQEREAIDRLKAMGFPEHLCIEAYLACDKNENLAVNYILSRMDEFAEEVAGGANQDTGQPQQPPE